MKLEVLLGSLVRYSPCEQGDFGPVLIMQGKHKGKIAFYEDDETEAQAIVYFGTIMDDKAEAVTTPRKSLARLPDDFCEFSSDDDHDETVGLA